MNQNLSSYYTFYIVAQTGNISSASKALFISQPAVSKAISKLEQNLNTRLLHRNSRGVTLTREGELLYSRLSEAFHAIELGEEQLQSEATLGIGHLSIGVSTTLCKYILLPYLQKFIQKYPHIKVSIACQPTFQTLKSIEDGSIDIGLIAETSDHQDLIFRNVLEVRDIFVTTRSYLNNLKIRTGTDFSNLTLNEDSEAFNRTFHDATLMLLNKENLTRQYVDRHLAAHGIYSENLLEVSTMDLLIEFAKIDIGIACVIDHFVEKELQDGTLQAVPLPFDIPKRKIGFSWLKRQFANPSLETFIAFLEQQ